MKSIASLRACAALSFILAAGLFLYSPFVAGVLLIAAGLLVQAVDKFAVQAAQAKEGDHA